jgi:hypothetical protein
LDSLDESKLFELSGELLSLLDELTDPPPFITAEGAEDFTECFFCNSTVKGTDSVGVLIYRHEKTCCFAKASTYLRKNYNHKYVRTPQQN